MEKLAGLSFEMQGRELAEKLKSIGVMTYELFLINQREKSAMFISMIYPAEQGMKVIKERWNFWHRSKALTL